MNGFIKIDRKMLEWEWYTNKNTKSVFLHCLLLANWEDGTYRGRIIPRGSFVSSIKLLAAELNLTENEVRTALKHLIETGEISKKSTNKYTIFTVEKYNLYQGEAPSKKRGDNNGTTQRYRGGKGNYREVSANGRDSEDVYANEFEQRLK